MNRTDPLPMGLAILGLGVGLAGITFLSLSADDVSYARSQWTAALSLLLASPAIILYASCSGLPGRGWRAFWTAGLAAYLVHFWWAIFRSYNGDFAAIFAHQGAVAYTNFAVTALWLLDVIVTWAAPRAASGLRVALRFVAWAAVTISFVLAAAWFRTGTIQILGLALAVAVILGLVLRLFGAFRSGAAAT